MRQGQERGDSRLRPEHPLAHSDLLLLVVVEEWCSVGG